jgi:hypothetical protein
MGWPIPFPGQDTTPSVLGTHALCLMCTQAGGTREGISISCLSFSLSPTNAHVFKIGTLVFHVILAKRQQDSPLLGFCYEFNKAFGVLFFF